MTGYEDPNKPALTVVPNPPAAPAAQGVPNGQSSATPPAANPPAAQAQGDADTDEFGYAKEKPAEGTPAAAAPAAKKPDEKPVAGDPNAPAASGYGEEPPPAPAEKKVEAIVPDPNAPKDPFEFDAEDAKDLHADEVKMLQGLAKKVKEAKTDKELVKALASFRKEENAQLVKFQEKEKQERADALATIKAKWHNELKNDSTFGGEKFAHNLKQVEKVLNDHLPDFKNDLTKSKGILSPNHMRNLATLANHLYSTPTLVEGTIVQAGQQGEVEKDDHLKFYNS